MLNPNKIKQDFPIFTSSVADKPLVYLDNAATTQKPNSVISALVDYYQNYNANIHRGIHNLSQRATIAYEDTRLLVKQFINAKDFSEIIFTRNTTESINLVAYSYARNFLRPGDEIVLTEMEHHANFVPWYELSKELDIKINFIPITDEYRLDLSNLDSIINSKTKLVCFTLMSNVLGVINDSSTIIAQSKAVGAKVLVDAAQAVAHFPIDVQKLDCDFLAFSFHKILGPTGVGVLWAKKALLQDMPPFITGGNMISLVSKEKVTYNELPFKFEAGTPDIANVVACSAAIKYLLDIGYDNILEHEKSLTKYALQKLNQIDDLILYGPSDLTNRLGVLSFNLKNIHPHDLGQIINDSNVAVRAGHHCCQILMRRLNISGTIRASLYIYNDTSDIDILIETLKDAHRVIGHVA